MNARLLLRALNTACRVAEAPDAWLASISSAMAPMVEAGVGVQTLGVSFGAGRHQLSAPILHGGTSRWNTVWQENWWKPVVEPLDSTTFLAMLGVGPVCSAQQLWAELPARLPALADQLEDLSEQGWAHAFTPQRAPEAEQPRLFYVDSLNLFVHDRASNEALCVVANRAELVSPQELSRVRRAVGALVPHLRVALRARGRLRTKTLLAQAEAIFTPEGAVADASGSARPREARAALRDAVTRLERARTARTDERVADAVRVWEQLAVGRWSLLDAFDDDGRRYLVALPKDEAPPRLPLSAREEQVVGLVARGLSNKAVAAELSLSTPTVGTLVARAVRKLGLTSRAQLICLARSGARLRGTTTH